MPPESDMNGKFRLRLVISGNRGIGLALVEALLERQDFSGVIATHRPAADTAALEALKQRHGARLQMRSLDINLASSLESFGRFIARQSGELDLIVHAAGLLHEGELVPEKSLAQCNSTQLLRLFEVNSIGPLMVAQTLFPLVGRNQRFTFAALSAMVGSIGDNRLGGWYGYRASKSALNQFIRTLANECRVRHPRAAILAIHPGTTDTELSRPFQKNVKPGKLYSPEATAARILDVLGNVDENHSGQFLNWDGSTIPW